MMFSREKNLTGFYIVNPPFAEKLHGRFEKPLSTHTKFLISLSNKSNQPIAILIPVRRNDLWFQTTQNNNQIFFVFFSKRFSFLQGVNLLPSGVVLNDNCLLVVGYGSTDIFAHSSQDPW